MIRLLGLKLKEEELECLGLRWKNWPRSTEEEKNKAEEFYYREVMPLLIDVFVAREGSKVVKEYKGMILSLGTSYEPLVLSIMALKPEKVSFLCTDASRKFLDPVIHFTGLAPSCYDVRRVDKDNPLQIYQAIKDVYQEWGQPDRIAVDFTGGTKAMSGGSAMAGGLIGADLVYIASKNYLTSLRRPFPGSEHLEFIPNPYEVFGDLEEKKGLDLMSQFDYSGAHRIFENLERQVPDPRRYIVLALLCRAYVAWDNLDIAVARVNMTRLIEKITQYASMKKDFTLADNVHSLEFQLEALTSLEKYISGLCRDIKPHKKRDPQKLAEALRDRKFVMALMFTLYCNALRREAQGKYDMASLLMYRLLELISQVRLAAHGLDTVEPNYSTLNQKELINRFNAIQKRYSKKNPLYTLPENISLFHGYIMLTAMGDDLSVNISLDRIREQVRARNYNIFAHGFDFIGQEKCSEFRHLVESVFKSYLSGLGENMSILGNKFRFIDIN